MNYGLIYWRKEPMEQFSEEAPIGGDMRKEEQIDKFFPEIEDNDTLVVFVDASHATCLKTRRSVSGFLLMFSGAPIAYRTKMQPTVATSSTEAEFIAAVMIAKTIKYLRSLLKEIGFEQQGATKVYVDNIPAIMMGNNHTPTPRARHIDVQYFALQELVQAKIVILKHVMGIVNPSDAMTKHLGWVLHNRHVHRMMVLRIPVKM